MNPILQELNKIQTNKVTTRNPMDMIQQFNQFKQTLQGRDPQQIVQELLQSGKMSPQQFEQLKQQASEISKLLK